MPAKRMNESTLRKTLEAIGSAETHADAAASLGISVSALRHRLTAAKVAGLKIPKSKAQSRVGRRGETDAKAREAGDAAGLSAKWQVAADGQSSFESASAVEIRTAEQALAFCGVSADAYEVVGIDCTAWQQHSNEHGRVGLWRVRVKLRPIAVTDPRARVRALLDELEAGWKPASLRTRRRSRAKLVDGLGLVGQIAVADAHFGKLCWSPETGEDYDTKIAARIYREVAGSLLARLEAHASVSDLPLQRVRLIVGNDGLHVDNPLDQTTSGTPQDVDGRWQKAAAMYSAAQFELVEAAREAVASVAGGGVDVVVVPGNHDRHSAWWLGHAMERAYANREDVRVINEPSPRVYLEHGQSLIGYAHGDRVSQRELLAIFSMEQRAAWGRCQHCELHMGHFHTRRKWEALVADAVGTLAFRWLPSVSGRDAYHTRFAPGRRAAEALVIDPRDGVVAEFVEPVRDAA